MSSVKIVSVNFAEVKRRTDTFARELLATHPEVEEVIVFGSFGNGTYAPRSDLDPFIVLREASDSPRDRMERFRPERFPVSVDVFAFTHAEIEERADSPLMKAVRASKWRYSRCHAERSQA